MSERLSRMQRDEGGLSTLEAAIVLIAFIVVASVFAFTMLSAGMFPAERSRAAVYAKASEVRAMEVCSSVVAIADDSGNPSAVDSLEFTIRNVDGSEPVDLAHTGSNDQIVISYDDILMPINAVDWSVAWPVRTDSDDLLETGEVAKITITNLAAIGDAGVPVLGANTSFGLEVKPRQGEALKVERHIPTTLEAVMDLE